MTDLSDIRALTFDVFGTVVDWRSSVSAEVASFLKRHGVQADAACSPTAGAARATPAA